MQRLRQGQTKISSAAELRDRVAFEERPPLKDGYGNTQAGEWRKAFPPVAAQITPILGGEEVMQSRLAGRQPVVIKVRRSSRTIGVNNAMRARDVRTGAIYNVKSIADTDGDRRWLDVLCETGTEA